MAVEPVVDFLQTHAVNWQTACFERFKTSILKGRMLTVYKILLQRHQKQVLKRFLVGPNSFYK